MRKNANLDEYKRHLASIGVNLEPPSAASLGIPRITKQHIADFLGCLQRDANAKRLVTVILPQCDVPNLVAWIILSTYTSVGDWEIADKKARGQKVKAAARKDLRAGAGADVSERLSRAEQAFDTRRMNLGASSQQLIAWKYIQFRAGVELGANDWLALLEAAYKVTNRERDIDGLAVYQNVRNLIQRRGDRVTGEMAAQVVERWR